MSYSFLVSRGIALHVIGVSSLSLQISKIDKLRKTNSLEIESFIVKRILILSLSKFIRCHSTQERSNT